jgi:hypothetical protein
MVDDGAAVLLAIVGPADRHEITRSRVDGKAYTELHLRGKRKKRKRLAFGESDVFAKDQLGRFGSRGHVDPSLSLDVYLASFLKTKLAMWYHEIGTESLSPLTSPTPSVRVSLPEVPRSSYRGGEKTWIGSKAEIECAVVLDYVSKVKRLPPFVPQVLGYEGQLKHFVRVGNQIQYTMRCDHIENRAGGEFEDPTLDAFLARTHFDGCLFRRRLDGIFVQILLALRGFQRTCGFVHNDFHTKNVLLKERPRSGPMVVHDETGRCYVFEDDVPLVKLIDFGHAAVQHPQDESGRTISGTWTAPLAALTNAADLYRLAVVLARTRRAGIDHEYSSALLADLVAVVDPDEGSLDALDAVARAADANPNVERFGCPLASFATPERLLRDGKVAKGFMGDGNTYTIPKNIFHELPRDGWDPAPAIARFKARERAVDGSPPRYVPASPLLFESPLELTRFARKCLGALRKRVDGLRTDVKGFDSENMVYGARGPLETLHVKTKRRVAWTGLVVFQRAVVLYLKIFAALEKKDEADVRMPPELSRNVHAKARDALDATREIETADERTRLLLTFSLIAACGGYRHFLHVDVAETDATPPLTRARALVRQIHDALSREGHLVAPVEALPLDSVKARLYENVENGRGMPKFVENLFEWSGNWSFYSFATEQLRTI